MYGICYTAALAGGSMFLNPTSFCLFSIFLLDFISSFPPESMSTFQVSLLFIGLTAGITGQSLENLQSYEKLMSTTVQSCSTFVCQPFSKDRVDLRPSQTARLLGSLLIKFIPFSLFIQKRGQF